MRKKKKIAIATDEEVSRYTGNDDASGAAPVHEAAPGGSSGQAEAGEETQPHPEADDWKDKFLRARAELSNYQRRSEKDRADALRYANASLIRALLPVIDDLQRVLQSGGQEGATAQAVADGVKLTLSNLAKVLDEYHVERIDAAGQPFDPEVHEAVMEQPSPDHDERVVLQVLAEGYRLHDRVLRPAKVIVSKVVESPVDRVEGEDRGD